MPIPRSRTLPPAGALCDLLAAAGPGSSPGSIDDLCAEMAGLIAADVATVYGLERGEGEADALVVVGNVGFPPEVVGNLRLRVGDGIVGTDAAHRHPIAIVAGARDPRFKSVRGIGEEQFPVLLAVPIARDGACLGVLVFQRRGPEFTDRDLRLARVLAGAVALALHEPSPVADSRNVSLSGRARSRGLGLGRVEIIPSIESLARGRSPAADQLAAALARLEKDLVRLRERVTDATGPELARALGRLDTLLSDARFREQVAGARDLAALSRDYARAPFQLAASATSVDQAMLERARDVEELCVLLHLTATGGRMRDAGRVWIGDRIGAVFALAATRNAAGVVLEGEATDDAIAIARATGLPLIDQVQGLFAWTRPDDLLVVDADRALVRVNPNASDLVAARRAATGR
jgi:phosphotransferase system enzyme I (PtsP)